MLRSIAILALVGASLTLNAQSLPDYLRMRSQHTVTQAVDPSTLDNLSGSQIFELDGRVKGSFRVDNEITLMVELTNGRSQMVQTVGVSDWLLGNDVPARLLVRATKADAYAPLRVVLIGAAPTSDLLKIEEARQLKAEQQRLAKEKAAKSRLARSKSVPNFGQNPLSGQITRNGTRLSSRSAPSRKAATPVPPAEAVEVYARWINRMNRRLSTEKAQEIATDVIRFGMHYGVDPRFVMAVLLAESGFDPNSVSRSGAMGLGQLMPSTAKWMGVNNPFDSTENLYGSVKLLRRHLDTYYRQTHGDAFRTLTLTLAAYNAGEGAVRRHGGVPPYRETQAYVQKVRSIYAQMCSH